MKDEILFLGHRLPFPPDRGDKIRSHHILKALAKIAPVHVATFADTPADWTHEGELEQLAASHCLVGRKKALPLAGVESLFRGESVSLSAFRHPDIAKYVEELLAMRRIETIYVFSGQMGQYVPDDFKGRLLVDFVDVDSAKFEAYAAQKITPLRWIDAREARLLRAEEQRLAIRADHTLLVSKAEAQLLRSRLADSGAARVSALRNGIDARTFDPSKVTAEPLILAEQGPHLIFTGQMDYAPNIAAARRVIENIFPAIRLHYPAAQFHVVGRAPTRELLAFDGKDGVRIWGEVPDVKPFLAASDIVITPLNIARGVQNKVLEAMAMALPVVLTSGAATGIEAQDRVHFAVEDCDKGLITRTISLLKDRDLAKLMGQKARKFVLEQQSWPAMLATLPQLVGIDDDGRQRDAA